MIRVAWALLLLGIFGCSTGGDSTHPPVDGGNDLSTDTVTTCNVEPTIASLEENYFKMSCTFSSCHSDNAAQGGLVLTPGNAYDNLVDVAITKSDSEGVFRVVPGDPEASYLIHRVEITGSDGSMPPSIVEPLGPDCQIKALREWIVANAPKE